MPESVRQTEQGDLFFTSLVGTYVENDRFVRREWLATEVEGRLTELDCHFVLLTAEPGAGKSTFVAQLAHDYPDWLRYFIRRDQRTPLGDVGSRSFLLRIGYQLAARHPDLFDQERIQLSVEQRIGTAEAGSEVIGAEVKRILASPFYQKVVQIQQQVERSSGSVVGLKVEELVIDLQLLDLSALQNMALIDPANALLKLHPEQKVVILVDALDEIRYHTVEDNVLKWLTNCPELPPNVRFVLSSRPPDDPLRTLAEKQKPYLEALTIEPGDRRVQDDVQAYVKRLVARPEVASELVKTEQGLAGFVTESLAKANGNLGYLDALERGIDAALERKDPASIQALLAQRELPADLAGLYAFFLHQIKTEVQSKGLAVQVKVSGSFTPLFLPAWPGVYYPLLAVLAVALEPLAQSQIQELGGIAADRTFVSDALSRLGQFLERVDGRYRLYHATMAEFLTDARANATTTADLYVDPLEWHGRIAEYLWLKHKGDWSTCDDYGLNSLATHLYRSEQYGRLSELISPAWMSTRYNRGGYTYDGSLADLALAWRRAHDEALRQIEADQPPSALAESLRYALIQTSINSLSGSYIPGLVGRALETGLWTVERALSVASRVTKASSRIEMLVAILKSGKLTGKQCKEVEEEILAATQGIHDERGRAQALAALSVQLTGEAHQQALQQGLAAAQAIGDEGFLAEILATLAPQLAGDLLHQGLAAAQAIRAEWDRTHVLAALAPQLTGELLQQALAAALAVSDEYYRAHALAALALQLTGETRERALQNAIAAVQAISNEGTCTERLVALAPQLTGELLKDALAVAYAMIYPWWRAQALAALVPQIAGDSHEQALGDALAAALAFDTEVDPDMRALAAVAPLLTGIQLRDALEAVQAIDSERDHAQALVILAPQLTGDLLREALDRALAIRDESFRAHALAALAQQLTGEMLRTALGTALEFENDFDRVHVLVTLAPQLTGELLQQVLAAAQAIDDEEYRAQALAALAPQLTDELLKVALPAARAFQDERFRARALAALAPLLTGELLSDALAATQAIGDEWERVGALVILAPQLPDEAREKTQREALATAQAIGVAGKRVRALATLAEQLTGETHDRALKDALAALKTVDDEGSRAELLAALAPQLTGELLLDALAAAQAIVYISYRVQAWVALMPQMTGQSREQLLRSMLAEAQTFNDERECAWFLGSLAPYLTGELLRDALTSAQALHDEMSRAQTLAALAPQLTGINRDQVLQSALSAVQAIGDEFGRAQALAAMAPQLTGGLQQWARQEALAAAQAIPDDGRRASVLTALAPQLIGELIQDTLALAQGFHDEIDRAKVLTALAPQLRGELLRQGLEAAQSLSIEWAQAEVLTALAPQLTGEPLQIGLSAAQSISNEEYRMQVLAALAPQLTGDFLQQGLAAAQTIGNAEYRARVLAAILKATGADQSLHTELPHRIHQDLADYLYTGLRGVARQDVLQFCAEADLFATPILDISTLSAVAEAIIEVCSDWIWL